MQRQEKNEPKEPTLMTPMLKLADKNFKSSCYNYMQTGIYLFIVSQSQLNLSLPCFVILELESTNTSLLPLGTMKNFVNRRY